MTIILIGGLWLDGSVWDPVISALKDLGHEAEGVRLPGQGVPPDDATLEQQRAAVLAAVDRAAAHGADRNAGGTDDRTAASVLVVGHSASCTLAWIAGDARPDTVTRVAMIGGFPSTDGTTYADYFEPVDGAVPFPGWEPFEGPDSADLDEALRKTIADGAIPVPLGVTRAVVEYESERRFYVPVTLICPEFSPDQAREWIDGGEVPELARAKQVDYVDIDSGHWPMFSCPDTLAKLLAEIASRPADMPTPSRAEPGAAFQKESAGA